MGKDGDVVRQTSVMVRELACLQERLEAAGCEEARALVMDLENHLVSTNFDAVKRALHLAPLMAVLREVSEHAVDMALHAMAYSYGGWLVFQLPDRHGKHTQVDFSTSGLPLSWSG